LEGHGLGGSDVLLWYRRLQLVVTDGFRVVGQNALITRSGSFDAAQGLLSAYAFFYQESEREEILSAICLYKTNSISLSSTMLVALFPFVIACFLVCLLVLMVVDHRHFVVRFTLLPVIITLFLLRGALCFHLLRQGDWKQVVVRDILLASTGNRPPCRFRTRYRPGIETLWCFL